MWTSRNAIPVLSLTFLLALGWTVGCRDGGPATYTTIGTVHFDDGTPVNTGIVNFIPDSGGPSARGKITAQGTFQLGTMTSKDGAMAGRYRVLIVQHHAAGSQLVRAPADHEHGQHRVVPVRYSQLDSTPLQAEVKAISQNHLRLVILQAAGQ